MAVSEKYLRSLHDRYYVLADIMTSTRKIQELMEPVEAEIASLRKNCKHVRMDEILRARQDWDKATRNIEFMAFINGGITDSCEAVQSEIANVGRVIEEEIDRVRKRLQELQDEEKAREIEAEQAHLKRKELRERAQELKNQQV